MKRNVRIENWRLAWLANAELKKRGVEYKTPADLQKDGGQSILASVPGNFELDFMREGLMEDIYFGDNSIKAQKNENLHLYYFTEFVYEAQDDFDGVLCFEGVDTAAEIYLDGKLLGFVENMFHAHRFSLKGVDDGTHTLLVHILPATIYSRQFDVPAMCFGMKYNHDGIMIRKAGSMFGWDIMPRIVSGGLWKPVSIEYLPKARIVNSYLYVTNLTEDEKWAHIHANLKIQSEEDYITDYTIKIAGKCGESEFFVEYLPYCASMQIAFDVENPKLWWPKNYGEPHLYDVEITLLYKGVECDKHTCRFGIRSLLLKRTSQAGDDGEFCFIVNGKKVFVLGTNWVPCDAFPSRHDEYTLRDIELVNDLGCNMIRCWGGNVYPSETLYNYCDEHGIMIWQDFALACGHYTDDERICRLVQEEVRQIVLEKRQHPSLAIWAGDNECDSFVSPGWETRRLEGQKLPMLNPNDNKLTREIIMRELRNHDAIRPYLPSSPYLDEKAWRYGEPSESHLWGPRDYFKGDYYAKSNCHFASEIGYHGCPSPKSIEKFIPQESLPKKHIQEIYENADWLTHAACMETRVEGNPYAYRLPLMVGQVERLFEKASDDLADFARQSQISQAEAKKFFIEHFRAAKWRKTGILWWNIIDGWPQISDAIVDWYGCKKLAYHYVKRAQQPLCMLCDEPKNGELPLLLTNDTQKTQTGKYTVVDVTTGEEIARGTFAIEKNEIACVGKLPDKKGSFYLMNWQTDEIVGKNHFVCNIGEGWTYQRYVECMQKIGFYNEFEGF